MTFAIQFYLFFKVGVLTGEVTRTWTYTAPVEDEKAGVNHIIQLRHHTILGDRVLLLDNKHVSSGSATFVRKHAHTIDFEVEGKAGVVTISNKALKSFRYTCVLDGVELPEQSEYVALPKKETTVFVRVNGPIVDGRTNAWYEVESESPTQSLRCHKRFSEFVSLDDLIKMSLSGTHMLKSMPQLP